MVGGMPRMEQAFAAEAERSAPMRQACVGNAAAAGGR